MLSNGYALYFNNAAVRVLEHPHGFAIFQYLPGPRTLTDLQAAVTHVNRLLLRRAWGRVLNDQRQMVPFTPEESAWVHNYWHTHLDQHPHGITSAVIVAQDVFARLAASQLRHDHQALDIEYHVFEDEGEAVAWLRRRTISDSKAKVPASHEQ
jgi:hypothetical protein